MLRNDSNQLCSDENVLLKLSNKAIVLLSGGLDSATTLAIAQSEYSEVFALSFDYGQRNRFEFLAAEKIAQARGVLEHRTVNIDLRAFGGSALTADLPLCHNRSPEEMSLAGVPLSYVPCRNTIFLSFALAWAEVLDCQSVFIGVNAIDYSGYPDCRPGFIAAFEALANLATRMSTEDKKTIRILAPLIDKTKPEIISWGHRLGVDYSQTISCYHPSDRGLSCGTCDACLIRQRGFHALGLADPISYQQPLITEV